MVAAIPIWDLLGVFPSGKVWQVGLAGVQVPNFADSDALNVINGLWSGRPVTDVLIDAVKLAGFSTDTDPGAAIIASFGDHKKELGAAGSCCWFDSRREACGQ